MSYTTLTWRHEDRIATIIINRPEALNAINHQVMSELDHAVDEVLSTPNIWAAIITGEGSKSFVAGADIKEFLDHDGDRATATSRFGHGVFNKIERSPKPFVAAINGFALGGGLELAMACHLRIAGEHAKMGQPELKLGLITGYGGTQRLMELIGSTRATEVILTGRMVTAEEALDVGLINQTCAPGMELDVARNSLGKILQKAPIAIGKTLDLIRIGKQDREGALKLEQEFFGQCFETADGQEGIRAFVEKRKPNFTNQ